jgi:hypothetical protein
MPKSVGVFSKNLKSLGFKPLRILKVLSFKQKSPIIRLKKIIRFIKTIMKLILFLFILFSLGSCVGHEDKIKILLSDKSAALSYTGSTGTSVLVGQAMTVIPKSISVKSPITSCRIKNGTTALPAWASLNFFTCVITGTPTTGLSARTYTIVAINDLGLESVATVQLSVGVLAPTSIVRTSPVTIIGVDSTPTLTVSGGGVASGVTVRLYSDSLCSSLVGSAVAAGASVAITTNSLSEAAYNFYANATDNSVTSSCSSVSVNYIYDNQGPSWANSLALSSATSTSTTDTPSISYTDDATDTSGSGIPLTNAYEYSIGSTIGDQDIVAWTPVNSSPFTVGSLTFVPGQNYHVNMRVTDSAGLYSTTHSTSWLVVSQPQLSFVGSIGIIGTRGSAMSVVPTNLDAGVNATISSCTTSGTLPNGVTLDNSTCVISGNPTDLLASTSFPITVTNSFSESFTANVSLEVNEGWIDSDSSAFIGSASRKGVNWVSGNLILAADTDCDGNTSEGETVFTNCSELDASWTPKYSSILSYWKMNNTLTDSKGAVPLTASGSFAYTSNAKLGSHAATISSSAHTISSPVITTKTSGITFAGWYYITGGTSSTTIFYNGSGGANGYGLILSDGAACGAGTKISLLLGAVSCNAFNTGTQQDIHTNEWVNFVLTRNGALWSLYINGVLAQTGTTNAIPPAGNNLVMGGITGRVDDFAIWDTSLTATEVQLIYQRQVSKYSGEMISRVFNAGSANLWDGFNWLTDLPYGKELPGNSGSENSGDYSAILDAATTPGVTKDLMDGLKGYWRLNETTGTSGADSIRDSSGNGIHGIPTNVVFGEEGKLGGAARFETTTSHVNLGPSSDMTVTTGELTSSIWIYQNVVGGRAYGNYDGGGFIPGDFDLRIQGNLLMVEIGHDIGGGNGYQCAKFSYSLKTKVWQHVVVVYSETAGDIKLYVDGELLTGLAGCTLLYGHTNLLNSGIQFNIGNIPIAASGINGMLDEFAIWERALSAAEIKQLYLRGANKIKYQTRSCSDATCSTNPRWMGIAGDPSANNSNVSYFSEIHNNSFPTINGVASSNVLLPNPDIFFNTLPSLNGVQSGQYFQYRAILESDDQGSSCGGLFCSPKLESVEIKP